MSKQIVILALSRVDSKYSSTALSIAAEYAKENEVYYINHPYTIRDFFNGGISKGRRRKLLWNFIFCRTTVESTHNSNWNSIVTPLTLPINWVSNRKLYSFLQSINDRIVQRSLSDVKKRFGLKSFVYHNIFNPFYLSDVKKIIGADVKIYHSVDDISQNTYTSKHGVRLEEKIARASDLVLTTSKELGDKFLSINSNTRVVYNAADFGLFNSLLEDQKESRIHAGKIEGQKVIGYTGNLDNSRIDYELIKLVAQRFSKHKVVLIGPINSPDFYNLGLDTLPNLSALGSKNINELPAYLKDMDVVLIPFKQNKLTASIYPLKINEYLAAGKSVVSTNFSRDIESFSDVIKIANNHEMFLDKLDEALKEGYDYDQYCKRVETASKNTWERRLEEIWKHVDETLNAVSADCK